MLAVAVVAAIAKLVVEAAVAPGLLLVADCGVVVVVVANSTQGWAKIWAFATAAD